MCLRGGRALRDNLRIGHIERRVSVGILDSSVVALRLVFECPVLSEGRRHWRYRSGGKRGRRGEDSSPAAAEVRLGSEGERESSSEEKHACEANTALTALTAAGVQRRTEFHEGSAAVDFSVYVALTYIPVGDSACFLFFIFSFFGFGARAPHFCIHRPAGDAKNETRRSRFFVCPPGHITTRAPRQLPTRPI